MACDKCTGIIVGERRAIVERKRSLGLGFVDKVIPPGQKNYNMRRHLHLTRQVHMAPLMWSPFSLARAERCDGLNTAHGAAKGR